MRNYLFIKQFLFTIIFFLFFNACYQPTKLEQALCIAGENRGELQKVLDYYSKNPEDSLKYKAACFLIENMVWHYTYGGLMAENYQVAVDSIFRTEAELLEIKNRLDSAAQHIMINDQIQILYDIETIKAEYLISNIDDAFETAKYTWNQHLSFNDFCEYILPYRSEKAPIEDWRPIYKQYFSSIVDSLINLKFSDSAICNILTDYTKIINYSAAGNKFDFSPSTLLKMKMGDCFDYSNLGIYMTRTFGIPVANDFVPQWGNYPNRHEWNILLLSDNRFIPFQIGETSKFGELVKDFDHKKIPKVYRRTYSSQQESLIMQHPNEDIPPLFRNPCIKDVTDLYIDVADIQIKLDFKPNKRKDYVYIMSFDNEEWAPISWGKVNNGNAVFPKMAKGCMYLPMYYYDNSYHTASYPLYIDNDGNTIKLKPDINTTRHTRLTRKYAEHRQLNYYNRMLGGKFQAANTTDFHDAVDLYVVDSIPEFILRTIEIDIPHKYKYFRYMAPDQSYGNIAELSVYGESGDKIKGAIIGTQGSHENGGNDITKVFDGDVLTYFDAPINNGAWVGLAFTKAETISKIFYIPRNDDNSIREGQVYELFYWDKEWSSLGQKIGEKDKAELAYNNVPKNALLLLRNHTKGKEIRIFTYENEKQIWW